MASVVTCSPTVMDGYVVRWYSDEGRANEHAPHVSASRNGVVVHIDSPNASRDLPDAELVHALISSWYRRGSHDYKSWLKFVTHESHIFGDVRPVRYDSFGEKVTA